VREFAERFAAEQPELHVLVNNAGVMPPERARTEEGFELTFATNVLGPFLLTASLLPSLRRGAPARVVSVSSGGMYTSRLDADDLQLERRDYDPPRFYAHTKRCEVVLTELWAERLRGEGIAVHAMHPGWADTPGVRSSLPRFHTLMGPLLRDAGQGADTIVWLASAAEPGERPGLFWHDRVPRPTHRLPRTREAGGDRRRLWDECVRMSGVDLG
jgi:NAD(P)-dependent dehydrogenase (short-subunit alcohol dehydrogenase family)